MEIALTVVVIIVGLALAASAALSIFRIIRGPSVVDRMAGSDTILTILLTGLVADMAIRGHTTTLPLVIALAMTASIGTLAVARYVAHGPGYINQDADQDASTDGSDYEGAEYDTGDFDDDEFESVPGASDAEWFAAMGQHTVEEEKQRGEADV